MKTPFSKSSFKSNNVELLIREEKVNEMDYKLIGMKTNRKMSKELSRMVKKLVLQKNRTKMVQLSNDLMDKDIYLKRLVPIPN